MKLSEEYKENNADDTQQLSSKTIRRFAFAAANIDRSELESYGVIEQHDDDKWRRFNNNIDIFILKLSAHRLLSFTSLMNHKMGTSL